MQGIHTGIYSETLSQGELLGGQDGICPSWHGAQWCCLSPTRWGGLNV